MSVVRKHRPTVVFHSTTEIKTFVSWTEPEIKRYCAEVGYPFARFEAIMNDMDPRYDVVSFLVNPFQTRPSCPPG